MHGIRLIIIEDCPHITAWLRVSFERDFEKGLGRVRLLQCYSSYEAASTQIPLLLPDVVLMDLNLPGGKNGIEATRCIKKRYPLVKVCVYSVREAGEDINAALAAGADAYADKSLTTEALAEVIGKVYNGVKALSAKAADELVKWHHQQPLPYKPLSPRCAQILEMVRRGMLEKEIADALGIAADTVRTYKKRILQDTPAAKSLHEAATIRRIN